jgi:peptidoglycan hydrolase-like protein with peptidoglycan-binding domain
MDINNGRFGTILAGGVKRFQFFRGLAGSGGLQSISASVGELAAEMDDVLPDGPEKSAGLRKLLEAKDCFVRAALSK